MSNTEILQQKVQSIKQRLDRSKWAHQELLRSLKEEYGCPSIAAAEKKLRRLQVKEEETLCRANKLKKEFEKKWNHIL